MNITINYQLAEGKTMANINDRINGQEFESASPLAHAVRYDRAQVKTEEQKKQARENIGCYCEAGGGGGGSSGGETLVVEIESVDGNNTFNKTAKEVFDACKTSNVVFVETKTETDPDYGPTTITNIYGVTGIAHFVNGSLTAYYFVLTSVDERGTHEYKYISTSDNDYPVENR